MMAVDLENGMEFQEIEGRRRIRYNRLMENSFDSSDTRQPSKENRELNHL